MTWLKKIKNHLFLILVGLSYLIMFVIRPETGVASVKNSGYYIKEMLVIMPVIFILTALLDLWIPKEKIIQYLGKDAKGKGIVLSFVIGSISAGPIYAAFPMCVMLHKKGASVRNITIILSSWAVIKVPMLLNEAKFLGLEFMLVRWFLTVVAILFFSWLAGKMVKDEEIVHEKMMQPAKPTLSINRDACMGCRVCVANEPTLFEMQGKKAYVKEPVTAILDEEKVEAITGLCPVRAIAYHGDVGE